MNKLISVLFFVMTLLIFTNSVAAKPIMVIVPDNTAVTLASSSSATINYTVTNNTTQTQNNFTIYPAYNIENKNAQKTATVMGNTCNTLAPNASCTFQVVLTRSNNLPATFIVSPRVCVYNNAVCSQPTLANRVTVSLGEAEASATLAYIVNQVNNGGVLVCNIEPNGDFVNCRSTGSNFDVATGIALNPSKTLAYVTNIDTSSITKCTVAENGELSDCAQTAVGASFSAPESIALDPVGEIAYIGGFFAYYSCGVDSSGELVNCTDVVDHFSNTYGVAVTPDNTLAYFANLNSSTISICTILGGGNLSCAAPSSIASPNGIALTSNASTAYIAKNGGLLSKCNIGTTLGACTDFTIPDGFVLGVALNFADTLVYVTNLNSNNGISKCTILPNGDVQTPCVPTGVCISTEPNCFNNPVAIALK